MKITLAKALKEKNKLAGKIPELTRKFMQNNSYRVKNVPVVSPGDILSKLEDTKTRLIKLKTAIDIANGPIKSRIYELAELKGMIDLYKSTPSKEGVQSEYTHGGNVDIEYKCFMNELQLENKKEEVQTKIDKIQDEIEIFNHTTYVDFE